MHEIHILPFLHGKNNRLAVSLEVREPIIFHSLSEKEDNQCFHNYGAGANIRGPLAHLPFLCEINTPYPTCF
jgi:hypothetical protein